MFFQKWFENSFAPHVRKEVATLGLEAKAVLVLDNCPTHPSAEHLVSYDGKIMALYLPPNVTSLIQPMDQGVLVALKCHYKRNQLLLQFLNFKSVNVKVVIKLLSES